MRRVHVCRALLLPALLQWGCIDTGQERASIVLELAGTAPSGPIPGRDGFEIELTAAELAFGPLYLCGGVLAGDNCDVARLEWLDSVVVNALDDSAAAAGSLGGISGPVRSGMCDFGIASLLSAREPVVLAAAEALGGNSVRLAGTATRGAESIPFELEMPLQQSTEAERGVSVLRISDVRGLERDVSGDEAALRIRFDPAPWVRDINWDPALAMGAADSPHRFEPGSQAQQAVRLTLLAGPRPSFEWISF